MLGQYNLKQPYNIVVVIFIIALCIWCAHLNSSVKALKYDMSITKKHNKQVLTLSTKNASLKTNNYMLRKELNNCRKETK